MNSGFIFFIIRRLIQLIPIVIGVAAINFVLLHLAPGDVATILAGQSGSSSPEFIAQIRHEFGLDKSLLIQFVVYMGNLLQLHLGFSYTQQMPVLELILNRLPATLILMVAAITIAIIIGVLFGVIAARNHGKILDNAISTIALAVYATPMFWGGLMLIVLFSAKLQLLPSSGMNSVGSAYHGLNYLADLLKHLILPAITLAMFYMAIYTRLMRSSMLETLKESYITVARAKGLSEKSIAWRHAVPNAILSVVTLAGVMFGNMLGGSVLIETVFSWPGLGRLMFHSLLERDFPVLLGILFISSILVVIANIVIDVIYCFLDPRIVQK
jgi:peptide/nickel transport system permease protein